MQPIAAPVFWSLLLAHVLGDFPFQTTSMVASKERLEWQGYLKHGAVLFLLAWACLAIFTGADAGSGRTISLLVGLAALHTISDVAKTIVGRRHWIATPRLFLADQSWHLLAIAAAGSLLADLRWASINEFLVSFPKAWPKVLPSLTIYSAALFGGGHLVRSLTKPLLRGFSDLGTGQTESVKQLKNAGMYIGWLERFLVISALALQSPATVGLILTAKSIVRFPELKDLRFAEYFLIGTLLSIGIALLAGMLLIWILYGTLSLK